MDQQATTIVEAIREAPSWVRLGIAAPSAGVRERAATELATRIARRLDQPPAQDCAAQLRLAL